MFVLHGPSPHTYLADPCRLTALSDFIKVETASFDAKEEEDSQASATLAGMDTTYSSCSLESGGHLKANRFTIPVPENNLPWAHEPPGASEDKPAPQANVQV